VLSATYKARVLRNGRLFHDRWDLEIERSHDRTRASWLRPVSMTAWTATGVQAVRALSRRLADRLT